ncbi:MAG: baseplate J/gp47 family protein [Desulfitobacterium sp.]
MPETKEEILARMLSNISDEYDKTEGSFFYDAEMPVAIELETKSAEADAILDKGFPDTATGSYLDKIVSEQGLVRKAAVKATTTVTITGSAGASIALGAKVASDSVNYLTTESKTIDPGQTTMTVVVECEVAGSVGNVIAGAIKYFPVTISGLTAVTNAAPVINGYDMETDDELRSRYYAKVQTPATSGNKYHYLNWAKSVTGVGDARVTPLWNGNGTVKVVIINSNKRAADASLVTAVSDYIEEVRPIGATVTVESAAELEIDVSATLTLQVGHVLANVKAAIEANLTQYLKEIAFVETYVSYARIGSLILDTEGVLDYTGLTVNAGTANVTITDAQVAVLGVTTFV